MSDYPSYLNEHCENVERAFQWLEENVPEVLKELDVPASYFYSLHSWHDRSKWSEEEYSAYDNYFYGDKSYRVVREFDYAWLHHIHHNPHHWQYWVLMEDEGGQKALEIPEEFLIEMICDWMSFSIKKGDMRELFKWYDDHKGKMVLHEKTRKKVEEILGVIDKKLAEIEEFQNEDDVEHSGIMGMHWGERHGPPYPLDQETNLRIRMAAKHPGVEDDHKSTKKEKELIRKSNEEEHPVEKLADLKKIDDLSLLDVDTSDPLARDDKEKIAAVRNLRYNINHPDENIRDLGRHYNCPNCASAFEMTRRGYDVVARPAPNGSNVGDITKNFKGGKLEKLTGDADIDTSLLTKELAWNDPDTYYERKWEIYEKLQDKVHKTLTSQGDGARGIVVMCYDTVGDFSKTKRSNAFHAFNYEVKGKDVVYYDSQCKSDRNLLGFRDGTWVLDTDYRDNYFMRTDNLEPSEEICKAIYSNRKKGE